MIIEQENTKGAWLTALKLILKDGKSFIDKDKRNCREVLDLIVRIKNPQDDILKPIEILNKLGKWIYPSIEELKSIILTKQKIPTIQYTYGSRIFRFMDKMDQIKEFIIPLLKEDPTSRRAVLMVYNPLTDSKVYLKEIPSLLFVFFKIQEHKLHLTGFIRSNDFFIGWPTNIYQLFELQGLVSNELGIERGSLTTISNSAHVFEEYLEDINEVIGKREKE